MRHAPDGVLRRLHDEPFAVPDATFDHIARCRRCSARRDHIAADAGRVGRVLSEPHTLPDVDRAWSDLQARLDTPGPAAAVSGAAGPAAHAGPGRGRRLTRVSTRTGVIAGAAALAVAGTAAAASWTTIFAPTEVAPVAVNSNDLQAVAGLMSFGDAGGLGAFPTSTGSGTLPFGSLHWTSSGPARPVGSLAQARAAAGFPVSLPARPPAGVGAPDRFVVQPRVSATVTFDSAAGSLAGTSVVITAGPAVVVTYGSRSGSAGLPTLGVLVVPRPVATSSGASLDQIEKFLLAQPGIPAQLSTEIRLLGDPSKVLPVPTPPGVSSKSVRVGRWPAVALTAGSGAVSAVVWEDGDSMVHAVAGLVDVQDVIGVADQLR